MAAGVPVVAAACGALPEVCGDGALLVDPTGPDLAHGLEAALSGGPGVDTTVERGRRRASTFTWEASAAAHAAVWRRCAG
jgi:glycosyltransferase involved in cell wall biosynthesis